MIRLGVSLAYGRDDNVNVLWVCIILTSKIGQRSERRSINENENENFDVNENENVNITACKGNINF